MGSYLCCYVFARVFWMVARMLLGCLGLFVACEKLSAMLWCSGWLPGCC